MTWIEAVWVGLYVHEMVSDQLGTCRFSLQIPLVFFYLRRELLQSLGLQVAGLASGPTSSSYGVMHSLEQLLVGGKRRTLLRDQLYCALGRFTLYIDHANGPWTNPENLHFPF